MLVLAHISDLHLDGTARSTARAEQVRDRLWELPGHVDALLVTGDIADHGTEAEYEEAARILGLRTGDAPFPVLTCPGNHDSRAPYRKALLGLPATEGPVNSAHVFDDAAVLMCDSSVPGSDDGSPRRRDVRLDRRDARRTRRRRPGAARLPSSARRPAPSAAGRPPVGGTRPAGRADGAPAPGRRAHHRSRAHTGGHDLRRPAAARRPGGDLDPPAALGGRGGRGPGRAGRPRLSRTGDTGRLTSHFRVVV